MTISVEVGTFISLKVTDVQLTDLVEQSWNEANLNTRNYMQREVNEPISRALPLSAMPLPFTNVYIWMHSSSAAAWQD